ncbi:bile acid:sodium symporter family protein [bacterium]|nr:bile acid:sodium symporter family protein [bacterium]
MRRLISDIVYLFPLWALVASILAYLHPELFIRFRPLIVPLLSVVMLGMGLTLTWSNFRDVFKKPGTILLGVFMQFLLMPLLAFIISKGLRLPLSAFIGMILVGSSPGGTASNVVCYLAGANVALSITLTMTSTLLSVLATPLLTWIYVNQTVPVSVGKMLMSVLHIVLAPVLIGITLNSVFGRRLKNVKSVFPLVSVAAIVIIIAIIVSVNQTQIQTMGWILCLGVILHNVSGLSAGYWIPRFLKFDAKTARTLSIEVGMQNSGLGVALAIQHFSAAAAIPGAIFSVWHNLSGSILAGIWRLYPERDPHFKENLS